MKREELKFLNRIVKDIENNTDAVAAAKTISRAFLEYLVECTTQKHKIKLYVGIGFGGYLGSYLGGPFFDAELVIKERKWFGKTSCYTTCKFSPGKELVMPEKIAKRLCLKVYDVVNPSFLPDALKKMEQDVAISEAFMEEYRDNLMNGRSNDYMVEKYATPESRDWDRKMNLQLIKLKKKSRMI